MPGTREPLFGISFGPVNFTYYDPVSTSPLPAALPEKDATPPDVVRWCVLMFPDQSSALNPRYSRVYGPFFDEKSATDYGERNAADGDYVVYEFKTP